MRQRILTVLLLFATFSQVRAQRKVYVHTLDRIFKQFTWEVDSTTFREAEPLEFPAITQPVDLGLSVKWADFNLGVTTDTEPDLLVGWDDVTDTNRSVSLKYFPVKHPLGNIIMSRYGVAEQRWGDLRQLPPVNKMQELINHCTWTWTTKNSVSGYQAASQKPGNTNSIFIPIMSSCTGAIMAEESAAGYCWSGILDTDKVSAVVLKFINIDKLQTALKHSAGCSIRPVYGKYVQATYAVAAPATEATYQAANVNASFSGGIDQVKEYGICYTKNPVDLGPIKGPKASDTILPQGNTKTFVLIGLSQCTTYYYQAYVPVGSDYVYGEKLQLTTQPKFPEPGIADLDLPVGQARRSMGARTRTDYGGYFSWGDPMGELFPNDATGYAKGLTTKDIDGTKYGIARAQWGSKRRLPTTKELKELEKCTWSSISNYNDKGIAGQIVSNNDKQLSFPRTGWRQSDNSPHGISKDAYYWSSELADNNPNAAKYTQLLGRNLVEVKMSLKTIFIPVHAIHDRSGESYTPDPMPDPGVDPIPDPGTGPDPKPESSSSTTGEAIDLGLSIMWVDRNVGTSKASDAGQYFAWAEIKDKTEYTRQNYASGYDTSIGMLTNSVSVGHIAGGRFDAARISWGGTWRLSTNNEVDESGNNCKLEWIFQSGVPGCLVTSEKNAKNQTFLPTAGFNNETSVASNGSFAKYWTDRLYTYEDDTKAEAYALSLTKSSFYSDRVAREYGALIRPMMNY